MTYQELLIEAENEGLKIKEKPLNYGFKGLYKNKKIIIDNKLNLREKNCILSEELGHYYTSSGNILDQTKTNNVKQEKRARNWAYEKSVGIIYLIKSFEKGIRTKHELAEYLNVTEDFLESAIHHYREKYGTYCEIDHYAIYFEPTLSILKMY